MSVRLGKILVDRKEVKRAFVADEASIVLVFDQEKVFTLAGGISKTSDTLKITFKNEDERNEAFINLCS